MSLRVELEAGTVQLLAGAREDVSVQAAPSDPRRAGDRTAAEDVRVDRVGDTTVVRGPQRSRLLGPGKDSVELVIELPEGEDVDVTVKYGSARLAGSFGAVQAKLPYGGLTLDAAETLHLDGGYGDFRATRVSGDADLRFKSGALRAGHVGGRLKLVASDGPVTVDRVDGEADLKLSSGALELGTTASGATVRAAYGAIRIREAVRGVVRIDGSYGDVAVGVRAGTAVWLDAHSQHGVVRTDLASDAGPAAGDETLELHIHTGYGSIDVHRSEA